MPIKKAALKRIRADKKRRERNMRITNDLKTRIRNIRELLAEKKKDEARALLPVIASRLDKAVQKKVMHRNKASRTISRLEKAVSSAA
ncbi:30S ribosomal protein S20 [Omnitrophica bacterium]|nr:30S ribosomal protein S20 [Candidatus Omnitrophota bacterium]